MKYDNHTFDEWDRVREAYAQKNSIKDTAKQLGISRTKVRKILITTGDLESPITDQAVKERKEGKLLKEIAAELGISESTLCTYLPYDLDEKEKSENARRIEEYRERIKVAKKNTKKAKETETGTAGVFDMDWIESLEPNEEYDDMDGVDIVASLRQGIRDSYEKYLEEHSYPGTILHRDTRNINAKNRIECIRLHLELICDDEETSKLLKQYGDVKYGDTISRDVVVPYDMQLWALHYMIQRAFGWQNSHLHRFTLPDGVMEKITDNKVGNWANLVGNVFRSPYMDEDAEFWTDDYESGSFKNWLRKKYTGPTISLCQDESFWYCTEQMEDYINMDYLGTQSKGDLDEYLNDIEDEIEEEVMERILEEYEEEYGKPLDEGEELPEKYLKEFEESKKEILREIRGAMLDELDDDDFGDDHEDNKPGFVDGEQLIGAEREKEYVVVWGKFYKGQSEFISDCYKKEEGSRCGEHNDRPDRFGEFGEVTKTEICKYKDLPIDALRRLYMNKFDEILERAEIGSVLYRGAKGLIKDGYEGSTDPMAENYAGVCTQLAEAHQFVYPDAGDTPLNQPFVPTVTKELIYEYDFGDNWRVSITASEDAVDLVESSRITDEEIGEAVEQCIRTYRPVMIARDGMDIVDDMGGVSGIGWFLNAINETGGEVGMYEGGKKENIEWAKSLGWSTRKVMLKNRL